MPGSALQAGFIKNGTFMQIVQGLRYETFQPKHIILLFILFQSMSARKAWTEHEDSILRLLKEQRCEAKWSAIARKMSEQFNIHGRTGKQCRERYQNHLNIQIIKAKWTTDQEKILQKVHDELGNKWVLIARQLPGRSDNCVKNYFYSKLRRGIRQLNKFIQSCLPREHKIIKLSILSKIIEQTEKRFENPSKDTVLLSIKIKQTLFHSELCDFSTEDGRKEAKQIVEMIESFEGKLKKQSKRHKQSLQTTYQDKNEQVVEKEGEQSFYVIFKRVCEEIMQQPK